MHGHLNGKLVHLVGFIIRIYHDARSPERQTRPRGLKREFAAARLLGLLARIPREALMSVVSVVFVM